MGEERVLAIFVCAAVQVISTNNLRTQDEIM